MEDVLIQMLFFTFGSTQKNKNENTEYTAFSYHSKVRSTQDKKILFFFCLSHGV